MPRPRISPSFAIALLALLVALSGTAYAAVVLPKNSVGSKQIKKSAVKSSDVRNDALTGADVRESTLTIPRAPGTLTLAGTSFRPRATGTAMTPIGSAGAVWMSGGSDFLVADVVIPAGARIVKAEAFILDQSANNAYIQLVAIDPGTNTMTSLDSGTTAGSSPTPQVMDLTPAGAPGIVDANRSYQLWYKPMGGNLDTMQLFGARFSWS
jgi:hypothetical protein